MEQLDIDILLSIFDFAYEQKQTGKDAKHCRDFFEALVRSPLLTKPHLSLLKEISSEVQRDKTIHTRKRLLENLQQVRRRINTSLEKVYGKNIIYIKNNRAKNWQLVINDNFIQELQYISINDTHSFFSDWCARNIPALSVKTTGQTEISLKDRGSEFSRSRKDNINQYNEITKTDFRKIEIDLKQLLKELAESDLSEKLHNTKGDYYPLAMEIGSVPAEKKNISALQDPEFSHRPEDHNRSWNDFDSNQLLNSQDVFILSSETGAGKTTLLRYLQLRIIERGHFLPIYLQASELEGLSFDNIDDFIPHLVRILKLKLPTVQRTKVFKKLFNNIKLLVDGLDQIEGSGTDYSNLLANLVKVFKKNLIIASRPFAVISQEEKEEVKFLRLKPFDKLAQENYFGNFYGRAKELCISCPELIAIPMLAYMVRTLVKKGKDKEVKNRAGLYKRFIDYIVTPDLEEGYKHDNIKSNTDIQISVRHALAEISFESFAKNKPHIQKIPSSLYGKYITPPYKTVENILKHGLANLIVSKTEGIDKCLYFSHQSFQEYLAAEWAHENEELKKHILDEMWNPKWKEVIKFLTGLGKEHFIKKIYSPECKDNCIHAHLFLAADCCVELTEVCETEKCILKNLKSLLPKEYLLADVVSALSKLNDGSAIDLLVQVATGKTRFKSKEIDKEFFNLTWEVLPKAKYKLSPRHCDVLVDWLDEKNSADSFTRHRFVTIAQALRGEHVNRLIDMKCCPTNMGYLPAGEVLYSSWYTGRQQIKHIFKYIYSNNADTRYRAIWTIESICRQHSIDKARSVQIVDSEGEHNNDSIADGDLTLKFTTNEIGTLMRCAETAEDEENFSNRVQTKVCFIMTYLATDNILSAGHIDWLIGMPTWADIVCSSILRNTVVRFFHTLSEPHVEKLLAFSLKTKTMIQRNYFEILVSIAEKLSNKNAKRLVRSLNSNNTYYNLQVLKIFEKLHRWLTDDQIDRIIDTIPVTEKSYSPSSTDILSAVLSILAYVKERLTSKQVDNIIENLGKIECNIEYHPIMVEIGTTFHGGESFNPLPKNLTDGQIEKLCNLLKQSPDCKRKLGVDLLIATEVYLPRKTINEIFSLLSARDTHLVRLALKALGHIKAQLSSGDICKFINCLSGQGFVERHYAVKFLIDVRDCLRKKHVVQLGLLLRDEDLDTAESALKVLAEIPDKLSNEFLTDLVGLLERIRLSDHVSRQSLATLGRFFRVEHIQQLIRFLYDKRRQVQLATLQLLKLMSNNVPIVIVEEVLSLLEDPDPDLRSYAGYFLKDHCLSLRQDNIDIVVSSYLRHPQDDILTEIICGVSSTFLTKHISQFVKLLDRRDTHIKTNVLKVLNCIPCELTDSDIDKIETILNSESASLRTRAYNTLKNLYHRGLIGEEHETIDII